MKLPNLPFNKKDSQKEYFLSIVIRHEKLSATVFEETAGKVNVVGVGTEYFKENVEKAPEDELLQNLDKAISVAESSLPENITTHKTIFGLKEDWIEDGKVKKDYLLRLKKACDELDLKPVGFLTISEAVAHLLEKEEGAPITAVLAEVGETAATVSLIKAGKVRETKTAQIHENVPFTVDTILKHFQTPDVLPSRILILDGGTDKMIQDFMNFSWSKSLPFLHVPQIATLPPDFDSKAVLEGAAIQMGFSVGDVESFFKSSKELEPIDLTEQPEKEVSPAAQPNDEFGFMQEEDIAKSAEEAEKEVISDNLVMDEEIQEEKERVPQARLAFLGLGLTKVKSLLAGLHVEKYLEKAPVMFGKTGGKVFLLPISLILILVLLLFVYFFKTSATITLAIAPKTDTQDLNVTFATDGSTDISNNVIGAKSVSSSQDGKVSTKATGTKKTGDKAKGKVVIFSSLTKDQTFSKGTKITSPNGLDFTLDSDAKVSSSSGASDVKQVSVNVTASTFGKEYNLPSGTKFSVGGFDKSAVEAKNDDAFSGGTEKDITIVSKEDQSKLTEDLIDKLKPNAQDDIKKKLSEGDLLMPVFVSTTFDSKSFDKDVDEEASEVSLTGTVNFEGLAYKQSDVFDFAKDKLSEDQKDLSVNPQDFNVDVEDVKVKSGDVSATLKLKTSLIPKIERDNLLNQIKGKSLNDAEETLKGLPLVNSVEVKMFPPIPLLPKRIPPPSRVKIIIETNG